MASYSKTGVRSKDIVISSEVSARVYIPDTANSNEKLPIIIYLHGGGFVSGSAFLPPHDGYVGSLAAEANAIAVSVEYRLAPAHRIPACYNDSWAALKWVASHAKGRKGPEPWINNYADFARVFIAGDSAGANIGHNGIVRASVTGELEDGVKIVGMISVHPYFGNGKYDPVWQVAGPGTGCNDPRLYPMADLNLLSKLICSKILVCIAELDEFKERGLLYHEALEKSDWGGKLELMETKGEGHCFHLFKPNCEKAKSLMKRVTSFIN